MARPQKDTVDYFPHDANAATGDTLTALQGQFSNDGYAFWFKLLEKLASSEGHFIDCSNSKKWQVILGRARVDEDTGKKIMVLLVEMQAIDKDLWENHSIIWCQGLVDNLITVYQNRRREIPQKPFSTNIIPVSTPDNSINTGDNTQSKVKESKQKETKEEGVSLSIEDVYEVYKKEIMGSLDESASIPEAMEEDLKLATERFTAPWVIDAIREGVRRKRKDWRYIAGILKNWERYGKDAEMPTRNKIDPDKYIKGRYGHMVQR